jgi:hypothetical protein
VSDVIRIPLSLLPHDESFLRGSCPRCAAEFKVEHREGEDAAGNEAEADERDFFCPLCHEASSGPWLTGEQQRYIQEAVQAAAAHYMQQSLQDAFGSGGGGLVSFSFEASAIPEPIAPDERHDMVLVAVPCHDLRMKVPDDWQGDVACHVCGIRYPLDLVRVKHLG